MDRLASMGVRCTDAHSPHSRCTTTRYALVTGRYCWRTRLKHWVLFGVQGDPLIERERVTLPEFLKASGYRTGMVGKWHLGLTYRKPDGSPADAWDDADLTQPIFDGPLDHGFDFFYGQSRSHGTSGPDGQKKNTPDQRIGPGWIEGRSVLGATGEGKKLDGSYVLDEVGWSTTARRSGFSAACWTPKKSRRSSSTSPRPPITRYTPSKEIGGKPVAGASRFVDGKPARSPRLDFIYQNDVLVGRLLEFLEATDDPRRRGIRWRRTRCLFSPATTERRSKRRRRPDRCAATRDRPTKAGTASRFSPPGRSAKSATETPPRPARRAPICSRSTTFSRRWRRSSASRCRRWPARAGEPKTASAGSRCCAASRARPRPDLPERPQGSAQAEGEKDSPPGSPSAPTPRRSRKWKLFLDHRFATAGEIRPQELYNLADDPMEKQNRLADPAAKPALDFLIAEARRAAGDGGASR
ncbi:MAG: sulfatase-like hydrolase/transferase [Verrucomicrobiales bacterium]